MSQSPRPIRRTLPRRQPRSLFAKIRQVILHPVIFFQQLAAADESRAWLWTALLILMLSGYSASRQAIIAADSTFSLAPDTQQQMVIALSAAAGIALGWCGQILALALVPMLRGYAPRWGLNLQIAIWAGVPLGLMALLQIAYMAAGGIISTSGVTGVLASLPDAHLLDPTLRLFFEQAASQITLFGFWSLALFFTGARQTLAGKWWMALVALLIWLALLFLLPFVLMLLTGGAQVA